jgi:hypothetical protein
VDLAGAQALGDDLDGLAQRQRDDDLDGFGEDRPPEDGVRLELVSLHRLHSHGTGRWSSRRREGSPGGSRFDAGRLREADPRRK